MAKLKIRLSISKPVIAARLNKEGGFQYSGTNKGSVSPKGIVKRLIQNISFLMPLLNKKIISQIANKIKEKTSHSLNNAILIFILLSLHKFIMQPSKYCCSYVGVCHC